MDPVARRILVAALPGRRDGAAALSPLVLPEGFELAPVADVGGALERLGGGRGLVLVDARQAAGQDLELYRELARLAPDTTVLALLDDVSQAAAALEAGAWDYALGMVDLPTRLCAVKRSLEAHARRETALLATAARGRAFLQAIPDMAFHLDRDGVYLDVHAGREEDLLAPPSAIIGRSVADVVPPPLGERIQEVVRRVVDTGRAELLEYSLPIAPEATHFEARLVPGGSGDVVCIVRNVTDRRLLEAQLRAADRLGSMGALSAGIAHEMNNPLTYVLLNLTVVGGVLESARAGTASSKSLENAARGVREALDGVERMRRIVADLRAITVAPRDEQPRTVLEVGTLIASAVRIAAATSPGVRFETALGAVPTVLGDEARLGQVFMNLLTNAAHATQGLPPERSVVSVRTCTAAGALVIEIEDRGHGISPEHLGRIFEPFFTTKPTSQGSGLGLWMSQRAVTSMGGTLRVTSKVGEGSMFSVRIPLEPVAALGARPAAS